jgi:hypothetical protein
MANKMRPGSQRDLVGQEAASLRRGAPGKRFIGERAAQAREAKQEELAKVTQLADQAAEARRREELENESVIGIVAGLAVESFRLARAFALAPFRILDAIRRSRRAEAEA